MGRFDGKVVLITGTGRGQGKCHAVNFAKEGANLVISDLAQEVPSAGYPLGNSKELEDTAQECRALGAKVVAVVCDITSDSQVKAMVDAGIAELGRIDILVNNAGWARNCPLHELTDEDIVLQIETTITGHIRVCKHVVPHMMKQKDGSIINISSTGIRGFANYITYNCGKHGMRGLTRGLAVEYGEYNIRANTVLPGPVGTGMLRGLAPKFGMSGDDIVKMFAEQTRLLPDVIIREQDISEAIMYIASQTVLTGAEIVVDAGHMLK